MKIELVGPQAYVDIAQGDEPLGRVVLDLEADKAPLAVENFLNLIDTKSLKDTVFHRVIKNFVIQGGDVTYKYSADNYPGSVGKGLVLTLNGGKPFADENVDEPLDKAFKLCMANDGLKDANGSQFFITTYPQPHLTGKHTVFGRVTQGKSVVRAVEKSETGGRASDHPDVPEVPVIITDCGRFGEEAGVVDVPIFNACYDPIGGDIYEEYPDDDETIEETSELAYKAASIIKELGTLLFKEGRKRDAMLKWQKAVRYCQQYDPDPDDEPDWFAKIRALKLLCYLNLLLVCLQLKNYPRAIDYATFILEMDNATPQNKAKALFRRGTAEIETRKYDQAVADLEQALTLVPNDSAILRELQRAQQAIVQSKNSEKQRYAKFFG